MDSSGPTGVAPVLQVHPSRLCNLACAHCYTSSGPQAREELHLELLSICLEDAYALGYRQLAVSGGEPLLYEGLRALLIHARDVGFLTTLTTNGTLSTPARFEPLAPHLDGVAVSIDGRPAEHDLIRRRDGAFARTVRNLDTIRHTGVPFALIFTLTQHNVDSLDFVVRLAAEHGATGVQVHPLTLDGRAASTMTDSRPDGLEMLVAVIEASRLGAELGVKVHVDAVTGDQLVAFRDRLVPASPARQLTAVAPVLVIDANASVVPMTHGVHASLWLGSLRRARLPELTRGWLAAGKADRLAEACARTWDDLTHPEPPAATYWYDEVAVRTHERWAARVPA